MSIIEKALGKVQGTGNPDSYDLKRIPPAPPRNTGRARNLERSEPAPVPVPTADPAVAAEVPARCVFVADRDRLGAQRRTAPG